MIQSVPALMLGIVIISAIGALLGYLLEPGRFDKRDAAEFTEPTEADTKARRQRQAA